VLAGTLPAIFAGLEVVADAPDLFVPIAWLRRGRPRPVADIVAEVVRARDDGLAAEGDDLTPGADPELPAVVLSAASPADEPVALRIAAGSLALVSRLVDTGELLAHVDRLRVVQPLVTIAAALGDDEQRRLELSAAEWLARRRELIAALGAAGISVAHV
jgi:hypothetical protein